MGVAGWVLISVAAAVMIANLRTLRPLWRSPSLERSQKAAQTVLMFLVPGTYLVVRMILARSRPYEDGASDAGSSLGVFSWLSRYDIYPGGGPYDGGHDGQRGDFSGHHGGFDGGGGHHGGGGSDGGGHGGGSGNDGGGGHHG